MPNSLRFYGWGVLLVLPRASLASARIIMCSANPVMPGLTWYPSTGFGMRIVVDGYRIKSAMTNLYMPNSLRFYG